jgi:hypothetical protein
MTSLCAISHNIGVNIACLHLYPLGCRHDAAKIAECKQCKQRIEMEAYAMSLIRNGDAVSRGRRFLAVLLAALLALFVFCPDVATAQELKQIKLTERHVQGFMAVSEDMAKLYNGANPEKPDPKREAQAEALVKKNGFGSLAEYDNVSMNISMVMSGIDQQSKKFTEPPEQIKKDIVALKSDKSVPEMQKKEGLAQLEAALKDAKPIQFKENIGLVLKYFDKLAAVMQEQGPAD